MRRELSSKLTPLYRWVIPAALTIGAIYAIWKLAIEGVQDKPDFLNVVLAVAAASAMAIYARYLDRAKRVWLDDDKLVVSDYRQETQIDISDVDSVASARLLWPTRINIKFARPSVFGERIAFFPSGKASEAIRVILGQRDARHHD